MKTKRRKRIRFMRRRYMFRRGIFWHFGKKQMMKPLCHIKIQRPSHIWTVPVV